MKIVSAFERVVMNLEVGDYKSIEAMQEHAISQLEHIFNNTVYKNNLRITIQRWDETTIKNNISDWCR